VIRILLIDDHEIVREGLKTILSAQPDFEVVGETGSAEGLIELVEVTRPDVVLLDARLPGVSGADACRALVAAHPDVAVLIVSTYTDDALVTECIAAGAKGYLIKDIERFTLEQSIRAVHRGEGAVSPSIAAQMLDRLRRTDDTLRQESPLTDAQLEIVRLHRRRLLQPGDRAPRPPQREHDQVPRAGDLPQAEGAQPRRSRAACERRRMASQGAVGVVCVPGRPSQALSG